MLQRPATLRRLLAVSVAGFLLASPAAQASRKARVVGNAQVLKSLSAASGANVLKTLPAGTVLQTSDASKNGYYRVQLPDGTLGYVLAKSLNFEDAPQIPAKDASSRGPRFRLRTFGGMSLYKPTELNQQISTEAFTSGIHLGGDLTYALSPVFGLTLRVEHLSQTVPTAEGNVDFTLKALPISAGLEARLLEKSPVSLNAALLLGYSQLSLTAASTTNASDYTRIAGKTLQILANASVHWYLKSSFGLFAEAGYRSVKLPATAPSPIGAGGEYFKSGTAYTSLPLNLSGPEFGGGFAIRF